ELFKSMAKVDITHVPYRGAAPALSDLMAGRVDIMFAVMGSGLPLAQSGQLRALAVTTDKRMASAPDIPTIAETGVPGYDSSSWFAFFLPAKTPPAIVTKVSADTATVLKDPAVVARLEQLGMVIVGSTPAEMGAYLKADIAKWGPVIKAAGIKVSE
ncbi:MAG: tripartite tricarboxylate transporter substrate-binding protein, partial [Pseudomonadota bacterium]